MTTISTAGTAIDTEADEYERRTIANAKNLLRLRKGEIAYDRMRGIDPAILILPLRKPRMLF